MNIFITSATSQRRIVVDRLEKEGTKFGISVWTRSDWEGNIIDNFNPIIRQRKYDLFIVWQDEGLLYNCLQSNGYPVRLVSELDAMHNISGFVDSLLKEINALCASNNPVRLAGFEPAKVKPSEMYSPNNPLHYAGLTGVKVKPSGVAQEDGSSKCTNCASSINSQLNTSQMYYIYDTSANAISRIVSNPKNIGNVVLSNSSLRVFDSKVKLVAFLDDLFTNEINQTEKQIQKLESLLLKTEQLRILTMQHAQAL